MIKNVIFDVAGVLTDYRENEFFTNKGYSVEMAALLKAATQDSIHWKEWDRNILTYDEIIARMEQDAPHLKGKIAEAIGDMHGIVERRETAIPWIRSVKETGRRVFVLSNFGKEPYESCREALDFEPLMDRCYWSFEHHQIKPEIACYLDMLYDFGIKAEESVFIDDTKHNLANARAVGIHTIHLTTQAQAEQDLMALLKCNK